MSNAKKPVGVCEKCGRVVSIRARGMCTVCYEAYRKGRPVVDCFARRYNRKGQCAIMAGNCRLIAIDAAERTCPFHKTKAAYVQGLVDARRRIASLPEPQRGEIISKYYTGVEA